jgi:release factor glutamine methyltransferase
MSDVRVSGIRDARAATVANVQNEVAANLQEAGITDARVEARDIIAALLDESRFWPSLNRDVALEPAMRERALLAAALRRRGAPFAYCVGRAAFRHLTLRVDERVLIPRQETEQLVELVLREMASRAGGVVADIGCGSGAIALSLAAEGRFDKVIGTDISVGALDVARINATAMPRGGVQSATGIGCEVDFRAGDLYAPIRETDLCAVVSNPPYVSFGESAELPSGVRNWEPPLALYGGHDGMRVIRRLIRGASRVLRIGGLLAVEVDARRAADAAEQMMSDGRLGNVRIELDLAGRERFVLATREN